MSRKWWENLDDLGYDNDYVPWEKKIDNLDFVKIKNLYSAGHC